MPYYVPLQGIVGGKRTLVYLDSLLSRTTFSSFFNSMTMAGHSLTYASSNDDKVQLKKYGEYAYDNIVMLAPKAEDFGGINFADILEFISSGGNVIVGANSDLSDQQRGFLASCGIKIATDSNIIDHSKYVDEIDVEKIHDAIAVSRVVKKDVLVGKLASKNNKDINILYRGVGLNVATPNNELAVKVLQGNPTSVGAKAKGAHEPPLLVAAVQGRNNARVLVAGSLDMFSNEFMYIKTGDNEYFCDKLMQWTFGGAGVLRFRDVEHAQSDGTPPDVILHEKERPDLPQSLYPDPEITRNSLVYRIKDEIVYSLVVEESVDGQWVPFKADDMQMEFVMLDAYVRANMTADNNGKFSCTFTAPDDYGIFKFRVLYRRPGYSTIHSETKVSLRPFKHDEYERFILSAYPYYTSAAVMVGAFLSFSVLFLLTADKTDKIIKSKAE